MERLPTILAELAADEHRLARMQDELACAVPHFLWSSVYGSIFGEGPSQDAFATTMWILDQRRIQKEGVVDPLPLPIKSTCFGNSIKDDIFGVEHRLNEAYRVRRSITTTHVCAPCNTHTHTPNRTGAWQKAFPYCAAKEPLYPAPYAWMHCSTLRRPLARPRGFTSSATRVLVQTCLFELEGW